MRLSGGPACIKYLLFVFNLVFVITGIVILCIGAVIQGLYSNYHRFLADKYFSAPALLIAVGVIVLVVSFLGCCGAVKENHCMVISFSVLLSMVFILELSGGIAGYVMKNETIDMLKIKLNDTRYNYNEEGKLEYTKLWDFMQTKLQCCGIYNFTDWEQVIGNESLPISCCERKPGMTGTEVCSLNYTVNVYPEGCIHALGDFVKDHAAVIGASGITIGFIQLLGVVLSCMLANYIRKNYESV